MWSWRDYLTRRVRKSWYCKFAQNQDQRSSQMQFLRGRQLLFHHKKKLRRRRSSRAARPKNSLLSPSTRGSLYPPAAQSYTPGPHTASHLPHSLSHHRFSCSHILHRASPDRWFASHTCCSVCGSRCSRSGVRCPRSGVRCFVSGSDGALKLAFDQLDPLRKPPRQVIGVRIGGLGVELVDGGDGRRRGHSTKIRRL